MPMNVVQIVQLHAKFTKVCNLGAALILPVFNDKMMAINVTNSALAQRLSLALQGLLFIRRSMEPYPEVMAITAHHLFD